MRIRRFFYKTDNKIAIGELLDLDNELKHRVFKVLRLEQNTILELITPFQILKVKIKESKGLVLEAHSLKQKANNITVAISLIDKSRFDFFIEKATELNADTIIPIITSRTKNFIQNSKHHPIARWNKISRQALSQCYRESIMQVQEPRKFSEFLKQTTNSTKLILSTNTQQKIDNNILLANDICILIGPEGGFSSEEEALAIENGFKPINTAHNILRTETAGISILSTIEFLQTNKI